VEQALSEAYRVLKPAGRFLFMEHGLSPEANVQKWQRRLNWLEMCLAEGCRLDRNTKELVAGQAFSTLEVEEFYMENTPKIVGYIYRGMARK
jgi:ubiquinone/menaquinone biosynthesis C-methylase UbiE